MKQEKIALESLSMDLVRIALSLNRGSNKVAERFIQEALEREKELTDNSLPVYINQLLQKIKKCLVTGKAILAEDILMYSILIQNYTKKYLS